MSINAVCDLGLGTLTFDGEPEWGRVQVRVGFVRDGSLPVVFDGLRFTIAASSDIDGDSAAEYPIVGEFRQTDQDFIVTHVLEVSSDATVALTITVSESGQTISNSLTFVAPRPPQPYPSWSWVGGEWTAPTSMPDDGSVYYWDEESGSWSSVGA